MIDAIVNEARARNVNVLDVESDVNHNRSVLTFVGEPDDVKDAGISDQREGYRAYRPEQTQRRAS